jgi:hypothetical protein
MRNETVEMPFIENTASFGEAPVYAVDEVAAPDCYEVWKVVGFGGAVTAFVAWL